MITDLIRELVIYGKNNGLICEADEVYATNRLLELFDVMEYEENPEITESRAVCEILEDMMTYAHENGIMKEDTINMVVSQTMTHRRHFFVINDTNQRMLTDAAKPAAIIIHISYFQNLAHNITLENHTDKNNVFRLIFRCTGFRIRKTGTNIPLIVTLPLKQASNFVLSKKITDKV